MSELEHQESHPRPLKHMSYPWEKLMTVGIAGICFDGPKSRIILCTDKRLENADAGGDVGFKFGHAGDGWLALIAGNISTARDFINTYRFAMGGKTKGLNDAQIDAKIRACARSQRRRMINSHVYSRLGVTYSYFLKHGAQAFPEDVFRQVAYDIQNPQTFEHLACELILAGFNNDGHPYLYKVHSDGTASIAEAFACVGTGATIASAALFQRKYVAQVDSKQALYYMYEAKRLSEVAPGVGHETKMWITRHFPLPDTGTGSQNLELSPANISMLEKHYLKCGLQPYFQVPEMGEFFAG